MKLNKHHLAEVLGEDRARVILTNMGNKATIAHMFDIEVRQEWGEAYQWKAKKKVQSWLERRYIDIDNAIDGFKKLSEVGQPRYRDGYREKAEDLTKVKDYYAHR